METTLPTVRTAAGEKRRLRPIKQSDKVADGPLREEEFSHTLLRLAQASGRRKGLPVEEAQDCGIGFVVHMLTDETLMRRVRSDKPIPLAWLHTCADHWAANYVRFRRRLYAREYLTADIGDVTNMPLALSFSTHETGLPEARLIRMELMQRLLSATLSLTDSQRDLFMQRYLQEYSVEEIARQTGRTPGAVKQALAGVRHRLQVVLVATGLTQEEIAQYLHLLTSLAAPPPRPTHRERED